MHPKQAVGKHRQTDKQYRRKNPPPLLQQIGSETARAVTRRIVPEYQKAADDKKKVDSEVSARAQFWPQVIQNNERYSQATQSLHMSHPCSSSPFDSRLSHDRDSTICSMHSQANALENAFAYVRFSMYDVRFGNSASAPQDVGAGAPDVLRFGKFLPLRACFEFC